MKHMINKKSLAALCCAAVILAMPLFLHVAFTARAAGTLEVEIEHVYPVKGIVQDQATIDSGVNDVSDLSQLTCGDAEYELDKITVELLYVQYYIKFYTVLGAAKIEIGSDGPFTIEQGATVNGADLFAILNKYKPDGATSGLPNISTMVVKGDGHVVEITYTITGRSFGLGSQLGSGTFGIGQSYTNTQVISLTMNSPAPGWNSVYTWENGDGAADYDFNASYTYRVRYEYTALGSGDPPTQPTVPLTIPDPETTVPETTAPETTVPETTAPETTVPDTTAPETTEPETTVPGVIVPESTSPPLTEPGSVLVPAEEGLEEVNDDGVPIGLWTYDQEQEEWIFAPYDDVTSDLPLTGDYIGLASMWVMAFSAAGVAVALRLKDFRKN